MVQIGLPWTTRPFQADRPALVLTQRTRHVSSLLNL